jgi:phosphotransferase system enzyme I (PtsI)
MEQYSGKAVYKGTAIGKIKVLQKKEQHVVRSHVEDVTAEKLRFEEAKKTASCQLKTLYEKAVKEVGEASAAIFEVHQMMLEDLDYLDSINHIIESQSVNAEYAVATTGDNFYSIFAMMDDEYMKERAVDVKDVSERLIAVLNHSSAQTELLTENSIIVADDLTPSETVQMDKERVIAFVTAHGSLNSHTAILARMMSIPAIVNTQIELKPDWDGVEAIVDGNTGTFVVAPTEDLLNQAAAQREKEKNQKILLEKLKGKESVTQDGRNVKLYANIGSLTDIGNALQNDAEGIGLFRSEFIYLEN